MSRAMTGRTTRKRATAGFGPIGAAAALAMLVALGGCGNLGVPAQRFTFYDLGLVEPLAPAIAPARVDVRAPSWLSSAAMQYRIEYRPPAQREAYSETRWVGEPAEMLRVSLDRALSAGATADGGCRLRLELDEFVQVFENERDSHAVIVARAGLLAPRSDAEVARRIFVAREPAPSPDAIGGVVAHRHAVRQLAAGLAAWLAELDQPAGRGLNTAGRCKR